MSLSLLIQNFTRENNPYIVTFGNNHGDGFTRLKLKKPVR
jgi:hypothetical protein